MTQEKAENLRDELDDRHDEIVDYVEKNSPRPSVDRDATERLLSHAPPAEAATELDKLIEGFESGAGAATGRRTEPAPEDSPIEDLAEADPEPEIPPPAARNSGS
ncbi:MAG TPA: hypothetical protein VJS45_07095 [Acidimicrobiia bacterium]|nr:hypothetical protein [Acidimicrobiia bacterium]